MDPKANLAEQLRLSSRIVYQYENEKPLNEENVYRLAELVIALDEWRRKGGFSPYA